MSGIEILGAVSAISALIQVSIGGIVLLRKAHERQKELVNALEGYENELRRTWDVIIIVEREQALQTAVVAAKLVDLKEVIEKLVQYLNKMNKIRSPLRRFAHQVFNSSTEDNTLIGIMGDLSQAKADLHLHLQVAHVGLTRNLGDNIVVNTELVGRIDGILQEALGAGKGLTIASVVRERFPMDSTEVELNDSDITSINDKTISTATGPNSTSSSSTSLPPEASNIILDNLTLEQALQINGPIGEKSWWNLSKIRIENNKASGGGIQINHAISGEVFDKLQAARNIGTPLQQAVIASTTALLLGVLMAPYVLFQIS